MSLTIPTLSSSSLPLRRSKPSLKFKPPFLQSHISLHNPQNQNLRFQSSSSQIHSLNPKFTHSLYRISDRKLLEFRLVGRAGGDENVNNGDVRDAGSEGERSRGESTMPSRFRYLAKEAPDPPLRWPFFVASAFLLYAWRAVLFELYNWKKAVVAIVHFVGYILKLVLALIFHFIGNPITSFIRCIETAFYTVRAYYSSIIAYAPIPELTVIIIMASTILAIAEATVPNSANDQPYLLTFSGLVGYAAVRGVISEPFFWTVLVGIYGFSRYIKKRDDVSAALPVAAVFAAVGEPWVRVVVIASYLALAISHNWKKRVQGKEEEEEEEEEEKVLITLEKVPLPLLGAALAIGVRIAAKWAGYRHLTWMIV